MVGRDYVLQKSDLALPQLEYVALGHVHRHQVLSERPHVVYSGSLQRVDFGEEKDRKGFCVVDLDPGLPRGSRMTGFSFEPVDAREFVTISVEVPRGDLDPTATVLRALSSRDLSGAVVRVQISLPAELDPHLRESDIRHALDDAHFVASISREIEEERRTRLESGLHQGPRSPGCPRDLFRPPGDPRRPGPGPHDLRPPANRRRPRTLTPRRSREEPAPEKSGAGTQRCWEGPPPLAARASRPHPCPALPVETLLSLHAPIMVIIPITRITVQTFDEPAHSCYASPMTSTGSSPHAPPVPWFLLWPGIEPCHIGSHSSHYS